MHGNYHNITWHINHCYVICLNTYVYRYWLKSSVSLVTIMGLTWIIGEPNREFVVTQTLIQVFWRSRSLLFSRWHTYSQSLLPSKEWPSSSYLCPSPSKWERPTQNGGGLKWQSLTFSAVTSATCHSETTAVQWVHSITLLACLLWSPCKQVALYSIDRPP